MNRKVCECKGCGASIYWIEYLGKKHPVDVKPKRGFVFIEDEYGNDIGSVEMVAIQESHFATCPNADPFRKKKKTVEVIDDPNEAEVGLDPLAKGDKRIEYLMLVDKSMLVVDAQMRRSNPKAYASALAKAIARDFTPDASAAPREAAGNCATQEDLPDARPRCVSDKCEDNDKIEGRCDGGTEKALSCSYRTGAE